MTILKTLCLLITLTLGGAIFTTAQTKPVSKTPTKTAPAAKKFESKEGNFSINLFQTPTQVRNLASEAAQKNRVDVGQQFFWQFEKSVYTIMYSNSVNADGGALTLKLEEMNAGSRSGLANAGATLVSEKPVAFGRHAGTEFRSVMPNGVKYIARNFLIGKVGYLITGGYVDDKDEKAVLDVINSFKLIVEKN